METQKLDLFIIDSNRLSILFKKRLAEQFGEKLNIMQFENEQKLLQKIDNQTDIIILYNLYNKKAVNIDITNSIKFKNPNARVILIINENDYFINS